MERDDGVVWRVVGAGVESGGAGQGDELAGDGGGEPPAASGTSPVTGLPSFTHVEDRSWAGLTTRSSAVST